MSRWIALCTAALLLAGAPLLAADPTTLEERLARLEKENKELKEKLALTQIAPAGPASDANNQRAAQPADGDAGHVKVDIEGPTDVILGDLVRLNARVTGKVKDCVWMVRRVARPGVGDSNTTLMLEDSKGLVVADGGRGVIFSDRTPAKYMFFVSVADESGHAAHDVVEVEIVDPIADVQVVAEPAPADPAPVMQQQAAPPISLAEQVTKLVALVTSANRDRERGTLAGTFRLIGPQILDGTIPPGTNPLTETQKQAATNLGAAAVAWQPFFAALARNLEQLVGSGQIKTPQDWNTTWEEIAKGLDAK